MAWWGRAWEGVIAVPHHRLNKPCTWRLETGDSQSRLHFLSNHRHHENGVSIYFVCCQIMNVLRSLRAESVSRTKKARVPCARTNAMHAPFLKHSDAPGGHAALIYGTAWKKGHTKDLVKEALAAGFRRIDTAAQPKHYREELVGEALREAISEGIVKREQIHVSLKSQQC